MGKNTLFTETARAAWADLTRTRPRDRTADDLSPEQKKAFAKAWSVDGDGIYHYKAYGTPKGGSDSNAFSLGYWTNTDPDHQVEKLFGRGTASWTKDGDLVFQDTYDLNFGSKNFPGVPTNADPDEVKIHSRISARAIGLDPRKLWETSNSRIQEQWGKLETTLGKVAKDVKAGTYQGQADGILDQAKALQARYNRINSGPFKLATESPIAGWKDPRIQTSADQGGIMDVWQRTTARNNDYMRKVESDGQRAHKVDKWTDEEGTHTFTPAAERPMGVDEMFDIANRAGPLADSLLPKGYSVSRDDNGKVNGITSDMVFRERQHNREVIQMASKGGDAKASLRQDSRGGDNRFGMSRNFLATDDVPDSIFGIPVVSRREDYTDADLAFFKEHPEAGGYYDMGEEEEMVQEPGEEVPPRADEGGGKPKVYGLRDDGRTFKGTGWLGELKTADGGVATEYSTQSEAVKVNGKRIDFPSLVPTLTPEEVRTMTHDVIPNHRDVPDGIMQKAVDHARAMLAQGKSVWANDSNPPEADRPAYVALDAMNRAIPFIREHEGFREKAYKCSAGHWTVGYGQTEINGRPVKEGDTITKKDAEAWLVKRVRKNAAHMYRNYPWARKLGARALAAAYDVAYNLGVGSLADNRSPRLTADMKVTADPDAVIWRELGTYVNVDGKPQRGLVNRRNDAMKLWRD